MISRERLSLWIGSGSPASIERAALVGGDAAGLAKPCAHYAARNCNARAKRVPARGLQAVDQFVSASAHP